MVIKQIENHLTLCLDLLTLQFYYNFANFFNIFRDMNRILGFAPFTNIFNYIYSSIYLYKVILGYKGIQV